MGKGATVSCLSSRLHPSALIREAFPNPDRGHRLENLTVLRQEVKKINRKDQMAVVMTHADFMEGDQPKELHAVKCYCKVAAEGDPDYFFEVVEAVEEQVEADEEFDDAPSGVELSVEQQRFLARTVFDGGDIAEASNFAAVDDDNEPAPENIPAPQGGQTPGIFGEWGHDGNCFRRMSDAQNRDASIKFPTNDIKPTRLQLFELLFPMGYMKSTIIPKMNERIEGDPVTYGELLRWFGLWFLMATQQGVENRKDFWSTQPVDRYKSAPFRLTDDMSRYRFDNILVAIRYTDDQPPKYRDPFHPVRKLLDAWNQNMTENFTPSWISCLDESMSCWTNMYTCPGFMFVPRKPWPFGNEYHTICCGMSGILFAMELVEGKDEPRQRPRKEFEAMGKTVGLLLRLTHKLWGTAKCVVLDSGFCVLKGIVELKKKGVYGAALIKKRRYWPKHIDGKAIKAHFVEKDVGAVDAWRGVLEGVPFHVHCMKEPDYVMSLMSTYGTLNGQGENKSRDWIENGAKRQKTFKYPEVISNHFRYRHMVDDHNARRQSPISLEMTWATKCWEHRVFSYLLATTEVNAMLASVKFGGEPQTSILSFWKQLAHDLVNNPYLAQEQESSTRRSERNRPPTAHRHERLARFKKFLGTQIVDSPSEYPQRRCFGCRRKVRTYCTCSPGILRCNQCYSLHVAVSLNME